MIVFVIGYMCSGKTTFGKVVSEKIGWEFIDMDDEVEKQEGMSINEIFKTKGEKYFRDRETEFIKNLRDRKDENIIVSTGGGAPIRNIELMNEIGNTIYLKTSPEKILERLKTGNNLQKRPLLKDLDETSLLNRIKSDIEDREIKYYIRAKLIFDGNGTTENMYSQWT